MICVAVAAVLLFLGRYVGERLFFGLVPVFAALIGSGLRRLKPSGHRFTPREAILAGLVSLAVVTPAVALQLVWMMGSTASTTDHIVGFLMLTGAGVAPLAVFLLILLVLRLVAPDPAEVAVRPTESDGDDLLRVN